MTQFSIIMPVYNTEQFLREAIQSVLAQQEKNWELICVDDGSNDGSPKILDEYAQSDSRIRVFHISNGGVGRARNFGLSKATGAWICWLDSDDLLAPWTLEELKSQTLAHPSCPLLMFQREEFSTAVRWNESISSRGGDEIDISISLALAECTPNMWQFAYRRRDFSDLNFKPFRYGEDRIYLAECLVRAQTYVRIDRSCYAYRYNPSSITHRKMTDKNFISFVDHNVYLCSVYKAGKKTLTPQAARYLLLFWTEFTTDMIRQIAGKHERRNAWSYWAANLSSFQHVRPMTVWRAFVLKVCSRIRIPFVGWVLCSFPHWLKSKGLHR